MTFIKFQKWFKNSSKNDLLGITEYMICVSTILKVKEEMFWKREKIWCEKYRGDIVNNIVNVVNDRTINNNMRKD